MIKIDPHDRIDLTGPWAGFGFQGAWWSLTCNIAREWWTGQTSVDIHEPLCA
nr:hypothetical protein [Stenotrophomonas indicatrix]